MRQRLAAARRDTVALYLACRDPRVPWPAKVLGAMVVAYALSPIDLIPDFIPVLGYLDDALLIPLGVVAARRMIPTALFEEHRAAASERLAAPGKGAWVAAGAIVVAWLAVAGLAVVLVFR